MLGVFVRVVRSEGPFALYNGVCGFSIENSKASTGSLLTRSMKLSAALLRQMTYSTVRFGVYEELKSRVGSYSSPPSLPSLVVMACTSGLLGGLAGNPADVMNVRMQTDATLAPESRRNYRNAFHGLVQMSRAEGPASLFRGVLPNSARAVLMTASQLASYDVFKRLCLEKLGMNDGFSTHFTASITAGFVATTVCSPVDVIKTRIMSASPAETRNKGLLGLLRDIYLREGFTWIFRGWVPSFIRLGPHTIATFIFLEEHKRIYRLFKGFPEMGLQA